MSPDFGGKSVQGELLAGQLASEPGQCCRVVCPGAVFFDDGAQARATSAPTPLLDPAALLRASRRAAVATHRPADGPVPPGAMSGMTYCYAQTVLPPAQITQACRIFTPATTAGRL